MFGFDGEPSAVEITYRMVYAAARNFSLLSVDEVVPDQTLIWLVRPFDYHLALE